MDLTVITLLVREGECHVTKKIITSGIIFTAPYATASSFVPIPTKPFPKLHNIKPTNLSLFAVVKSLVPSELNRNIWRFKTELKCDVFSVQLLFFAKYVFLRLWYEHCQCELRNDCLPSTYRAGYERLAGNCSSPDVRSQGRNDSRRLFRSFDRSLGIILTAAKRKVPALPPFRQPNNVT